MKNLSVIKNILLTLTLLLSSQSAFAQGKIQGYVERGGYQFSPTTVDRVQRSYPNSTVTVYLTGTVTLASIFSNSTLTTPKSNPFTADSTGFYNFYAANGNYDLQFSGTGITTPFTLSSIGSTVVADASDSTKGITKLTVAPISATNPIARGSNDPVLFDAKEYGTFANAVSTLCSSDDNAINVSTIMQVSSNIVIPSGCDINFIGVGQLSIDTGISVTLNVLSKIAGGNKKLFAGLGLVILPSSGYSYIINPVWWMDGEGTWANQWTGINKLQFRDRTRCDFPFGVYTYSSSHAFSHPGIRLYGYGGAIFNYTGTGAIVDILSGSNSPGTHTYDMAMDGFLLQGVTASHGLYVNTTHQSTFSNIRVFNMGGIAFFFRSSNSDTLLNLAAADPIGSFYQPGMPAVTIVPTTGLMFAQGKLFPADAPTNNDMHVIGAKMHYINGRGLDIRSLIASDINGSFEGNVEEGIVVTSGDVSLTNNVTFNNCEAERNIAGDIYVNATNITFINSFLFDGVINIDAGAVNTTFLGGIYDTINLLGSSKSTSLINVQYNFSGSGNLTNGGQNTFIKNVRDIATGLYYPDTFFGIANTPTTITANVNNWNPGRNLNIRACSDAPRHITGMANLQTLEDGRIQYIWNVCGFDIVLDNESASSSAANRFTNSTGADLTLAPKKVVMVMYDNSSQRWRVTLLP